MSEFSEADGLMESPTGGDEGKIDPKKHPKYKQIQAEVEKERQETKYRYFNDDYALLRLNRHNLPEQFSSKTAGWKPGGFPSLRAAELDYQGAYDLAYRIVNSFGDPEDLKTLDIGPESWLDEPEEKDSE
jgi:hypothetical protein